jgi:RND superfamily putative drug exporter
MRALDVPYPVQVGGETAGFLDQQESIGSSLPLALAILATTTLVILFAMTGSVVLPVKALLMNLLTVSAAFGLLVLIFQDGRLEELLAYESQGALEATQPVLLFCVAFGLSTDYGVFLLTRIKEARDGGLRNDAAVAAGLQRTGRIVTAAAILFCIAIGAFVTSEMIFIKQLGLGTALAVLIDATIVRALLVPSLMALLGEWNWWAPRPLARLHERIGLRESPA